MGWFNENNSWTHCNSWTCSPPAARFFLTICLQLGIVFSFKKRKKYWVLFGVGGLFGFLLLCFVLGGLVANVIALEGAELPLVVFNCDLSLVLAEKSGR